MNLIVPHLPSNAYNIQVSNYGMHLEVQVGTPRKFLDEGLMGKKYEDAYNTTLPAVQKDYKVIQEVCADHPGDNPFSFHPS